MFKNKRTKGKKFIIYHFRVESKPHERIDLLITASVNILPEQFFNDPPLCANFKIKTPTTI